MAEQMIHMLEKGMRFERVGDIFEIDSFYYDKEIQELKIYAKEINPKDILISQLQTEIAELKEKNSTNITSHTNEQGGIEINIPFPSHESPALMTYEEWWRDKGKILNFDEMSNRFLTVEYARYLCKELDTIPHYAFMGEDIFSIWGMDFKSPLIKLKFEELMTEPRLEILRNLFTSK